MSTGASCSHQSFDRLDNARAQCRGCRAIFPFQLPSAIVPASSSEEPPAVSSTQPPATGPHAWSSDIKTILQQQFRHAAFRTAQEQIINAALQKRDVFAVLPTSGGKSLCFQLPALYDRGVTIVISPLIALMENQYAYLKGLDIPAAVIRSEIKDQTIDAIWRSVHAGIVKIVYTTPEQWAVSTRMHNECQRLYKKSMIARLVVDECQCIVEWGLTDFRADYLKLGSFRSAFRNVPIMAVTATATKESQAYILQNLHAHPDTAVFRQPLDRPNLIYGVERKRRKAPVKELRENNLHIPKALQRVEEVAAEGNDLCDNDVQVIESAVSKTSEVADTKVLGRDAHSLVVNRIHADFQGQCGIVYCATVDECNELARMLQKHNISAERYYAKLDSAEKRAAQHKWMNGEVDVMIATIAFGLGIDKPNVRFVMHTSMPQNLERYYQESSRAGRDGQPAHCIIYWSAADKVKLERLQSEEYRKKSPTHRAMPARDLRQIRQRLYQVLAFCENKYECRRDLLMKALGEQVKLRPADAGSDRQCCNTCSSNAVRQSQTRDIALQCKQLIQILEQLQQQNNNLNTKAKLIGVFRGSKQKAVVSNHLDSLPLYGVGKTDRWLTEVACNRIVSELVSLGVLYEDTAVTYAADDEDGSKRVTLLRVNTDDDEAQQTYDALMNGDPFTMVFPAEDYASDDDDYADKKKTTTSKLRSAKGSSKAKKPKRRTDEVCHQDICTEDEMSSDWESLTESEGEAAETADDSEFEGEAEHTFGDMPADVLSDGEFEMPTADDSTKDVPYLRRRVRRKASTATKALHPYHTVGRVIFDSPILAPLRRSPHKSTPRCVSSPESDSSVVTISPPTHKLSPALRQRSKAATSMLQINRQLSFQDESLSKLTSPALRAMRAVDGIYTELSKTFSSVHKPNSLSERLQLAIESGEDSAASESESAATPRNAILSLLNRCRSRRRKRVLAEESDEGEANPSPEDDIVTLDIAELPATNTVNGTGVETHSTDVTSISEQITAAASTHCDDDDIYATVPAFATTPAVKTEPIDLTLDDGEPTYDTQPQPATSVMSSIISHIIDVECEDNEVTPLRPTKRRHVFSLPSNLALSSSSCVSNLGDSTNPSPVPSLSSLTDSSSTSSSMPSSPWSNGSLQTIDLQMHASPMPSLPIDIQMKRPVVENRDIREFIFYNWHERIISDWLRNMPCDDPQVDVDNIIKLFRRHKVNGESLYFSMRESVLHAMNMPLSERLWFIQRFKDLIHHPNFWDVKFKRWDQIQQHDSAIPAS